MNGSVFYSFMFLLLLSPVHSFGTYWVDRSCRRPDRHFERAFEDYQTWARRGAERLSARDPLQTEYFDRLFNSPSPHYYQDAMTLVTLTLGGGNGVSNMLPEPSGNRTQANYRFYCDNDSSNFPVENANRNPRWRLRADPDPAPAGYLPQERRPFILNRGPGQEQYREYIDEDNGILGTGGCAMPHVLAVTHRAKMPQILPGQPENRATVTVCDSLLNERLPDLGATFIPTGIPIDNFKAVTAFSLLHESTHLPDINLNDQPFRLDRSGFAYGWYAATALTSQERLQNPDNYAFFSLVCTPNQIPGTVLIL
ncbi:MAG: hypothetical protein Q9227_003043 [Pyrenula ochraceoflavens]